MWRFAAATTVGVGTAGALIRGMRGKGSSSALGGLGQLPRTAAALFGSIVSFSVTLHFAEVIVKSGVLASRVLAFTLDGLLADTVGRGDGDESLWKREGLTVAAVSKFRENEAAVAAERQEQQVAAKAKAEETLETLEAKILAGEAKDDASEGGGGEGQASAAGLELELVEARAQHRTLLVTKLLSMRREEALLETQLSSQREVARSVGGSARERTQANVDALEGLAIDVEERKKALKRDCTRLHGTRLSRLCDDELFVVVKQLERMRTMQLQLARQAKEVGTADKLSIRKRLREMDVDKAELKRTAADVFGVRISARAKSVTSYKTVI